MVPTRDRREQVVVVPLAGNIFSWKQATPEAFLGGDERSPLPGDRFFLSVQRRMAARMEQVAIRRLNAQADQASMLRPH